MMSNNSQQQAGFPICPELPQTGKWTDLEWAKFLTDMKADHPDRPAKVSPRAFRRMILKAGIPNCIRFGVMIVDAEDFYDQTKQAPIEKRKRGRDDVATSDRDMGGDGDDPEQRRETDQPDSPKPRRRKGGARHPERPGEAKGKRPRKGGGAPEE